MKTETIEDPNGKRTRVRRIRSHGITKIGYGETIAGPVLLIHEASASPLMVDLTDEMAASIVKGLKAIARIRARRS